MNMKMVNEDENNLNGHGMGLPAGWVGLKRAGGRAGGHGTACTFV